jgi:hypothetical protein
LSSPRRGTIHAPAASRGGGDPVAPEETIVRRHPRLVQPPFTRELLECRGCGRAAGLIAEVLARLERERDLARTYLEQRHRRSDF